MVEAKGTLRPGDYIRAQYLHYRPGPVYKVVGALVLLVFAWAAWLAFTREDIEFLDTLFVVALVFLALSFVVYLPWKTKRLYRQQKAIQRELVYVFGDDGVSVSSQHGQSFTPWDDFLTWKKNDRMILVYMSDCMFQMLPERLFSDRGDFDRVKELMREHIGKATG